MPKSSISQKNPWAKEEVRRYHKYFKSSEDKFEDVDQSYNYPEYNTPVECGNCGKDAWMKASVGAYVCPHCGAIKCIDGNWSEGG